MTIYKSPTGGTGLASSRLELLELETAWLLIGTEYNYLSIKVYRAGPLSFHFLQCPSQKKEIVQL